METADFIARPLKSFRDYRQEKRIEKFRKSEKERKQKEKTINRRRAQTQT
jgi:hypothetical protein